MDTGEMKKFLRNIESTLFPEKTYQFKLTKSQITMLKDALKQEGWRAYPYYRNLDADPYDVALAWRIMELEKEEADSTDGSFCPLPSFLHCFEFDSCERKWYTRGTRPIPDTSDTDGLPF